MWLLFLWRTADITLQLFFFFWGLHWHSVFTARPLGTFNNTAIFVRKKHKLWQSISARGAWENESYGKYYFGLVDVRGNSTQHDNLLYFRLFYKILCHLWLQWAECISYTCVTNDILPALSLCIVATLALGGPGKLHSVRCLHEYGAVFTLVSEE